MAFTLKRWTGAVLAGMVLIASWRMMTDPAPRPGPEPLPPAVERHTELRREMSDVRLAIQQLRWADSLAPLVVERAEDGLAIALPVGAGELAEVLGTSVRGAEVTAAAPGVATEAPSVTTNTAGTDAAPVRTGAVGSTTNAAGATTADTGVSAADLAAAEALLERFRRAVRTDADALGPRRSDVLVGYVYQRMSHGVEPGTPYAASPRNETYAGTLEGTRYCIQVRGVHEGRLTERLMEDVERSEAARAGWAAPGRILGPCGFYARHGMPGGHVLSWLERGATVMATGPWTDPDPLAASEPETLFGSVRFDRRAAFGLRLGGMRALPVESCLSGDADACASAFLDPAALLPARFPRGEGPAMRNFDRGWSPLADLGGLLYDLEAEHGPAAFGRFWRSYLPVREAFEAAFGTEPGPWVLAWVDRRLGVEASGPALPRSAALGGLLALGLLAAVATARQGRRSVGQG